MGFREELLDAGDADGAGAAPGHVVVLLQAAGPVVQGPALRERVSQGLEFVDCRESRQVFQFSWIEVILGGTEGPLTNTD